MEFDHGIGRLVVELKEQHLASMETNKELIAIELNAGDLYLVIVTARVPESNLSRRQKERERVSEGGRGERLHEYVASQYYSEHTTHGKG